MNSQPFWSDPIGIVAFAVMVAVIALVVWSAARLHIAFRRLRLVIPLAALGLGGFGGYRVLQFEWSDAAFLVRQFVFLIALGVVVSGAMALSPGTRQVGRRGVVGTLLMLTGFVAVYLGGYLLGLQGWRPEP